MLIVALVLAVIGLAALVTAVVTSNELIAWVCIGASVLGVLLLIVDALRERSHGDDTGDADESDDGGLDDLDETTVLPATDTVEDYPDVPAETPSDDETTALASTDDDESDTARPGSTPTAP